jgi:hypothetical protein
MALVLESSSLQALDMVPILQEFVSHIDPQWSQGDAAFTQLSDLFTGALEHGLLKLDAGLKERPEGLKAYAQARAQRLHGLEAGAVRITLSRGATDERLRVGVHESILGSDSITAVAETVLWDDADLAPDARLPAVADDTNQPMAAVMHGAIPAAYDGIDVATVRLRPLAPH